MPKENKEFNPAVLQSKQELHDALERGDIKSSKYMTLNEPQREFVSLIVFSGYKPIQAMRLVMPHIKNPSASAKAWAANPDVADVLEELTFAKKAHWMAQLENEREMSLHKMVHIRNTTEDEALAAATSDKIWSRANEELVKKNEVVDPVNGFKFVLMAAPVPEYLGGKNFNPSDIVEGVASEQDGEVSFNYAEASRKNYNK